MFKRMFLFALLLSAVFLIAADATSGDVIPAVLVTVVCAAVPFVVEGVKWLVDKVPKMGWLGSPFFASVFAFIVAYGVAAFFTVQLGLLPPLVPTCDASHLCQYDMNSVFDQLVKWAAIIMAAATGFYNLLYRNWLDSLAKPKNVLSYRIP